MGNWTIDNPRQQENYRNDREESHKTFLNYINHMISDKNILMLYNRTNCFELNNLKIPNKHGIG